MIGLHIISFGFIVLIMFAVTDVNQLSEDRDIDIDKRIDELEIALAAKIPAKIKFYTIPGYKCDTSEIPGYCSNMYPVTQAEYDKNNSHLFNVTR